MNEKLGTKYLCSTTLRHLCVSKKINNAYDFFYVYTKFFNNENFGDIFFRHSLDIFGQVRKTPVLQLVTIYYNYMLLWICKNCMEILTLYINLLL